MVRRFTRFQMAILIPRQHVFFHTIRYIARLVAIRPHNRNTKRSHKKTRFKLYTKRASFAHDGSPYPKCKRPL